MKIDHSKFVLAVELKMSWTKFQLILSEIHLLSAVLRHQRIDVTI